MERIKQVVKIAKAAGEIIMQVYEASKHIKYDKKDDNSPLTEADSKANEYICNQLKAHYPEIPIVSEENKNIPYSERKDFDSFWMVDPLDGTKEFIKRNGEFTVNIALIKNGQPVLGVVYAPALNEMYWAEKDQGAFAEIEEKTQKLEAAKFNKADKNLGIICSRSHLNDETKAFIEDYSEPDLVSKGSSLKFLLLAKGEAHIYPRIAPTMEWDTAAAQIVLEEAGGTVVRFEDELPLEYNKENLLNPYFVAYAQMSN